MTKKDYKLIAEAIFQAEISWEATQIVAEELAKVMKKDNLGFDQEKFIKACLGE